jgi:hypothetical protein
MNKPNYPYNLERIERYYNPEHDLFDGIQANIVDYILMENVQYLLDEVQRLKDHQALTDEKIRKLAKRVQHLPHEVE